jgi:hypothetical protein
VPCVDWRFACVAASLRPTALPSPIPPFVFVFLNVSFDDKTQGVNATATCEG